MKSFAQRQAASIELVFGQFSHKAHIPLLQLMYYLLLLHDLTFVVFLSYYVEVHNLSIHRYPCS